MYWIHTFNLFKQYFTVNVNQHGSTKSKFVDGPDLQDWVHHPQYGQPGLYVHTSPKFAVPRASCIANLDHGSPGDADSRDDSKS